MNAEVPPQSGESGGWRLAVAGAVAGITAGGFLGTLLAFLFVPETGDWYRGGYEPAVAFVGALGAWSFCPYRGLRGAALGAAAALLAMLLSDVFRLMLAAPLFDDVMKDLGRTSEHLRRSLRLFAGSLHWRRLVRYGFGIYLGGYLGAAGPLAAPTGTPVTPIPPAAGTEQAQAGDRK